MQHFNTKYLVLLSFFLVCLLGGTGIQAEPVKFLPKDAKIIVIGGALTEIVYALGAQERMIGRDTTSTFPISVQNLPDVGYMRALSPEGVLSLKPQGLILSEGSGPPQALEVLQKLSLPMVIVPEHHSRIGIMEKISIVGQALGYEEEASTLIQSLEHDFVKVEYLLSKIEQKKRVLFVLSLQNGRILAAGKETAADGMIALAGGQNAVENFSGYKLINDEALIEAAPDLILTMSGGGSGHDIGKQLLEIPAILTTPAAKTGQIHQMDGLFLLGFGPRSAAAAYQLASYLYDGHDFATDTAVIKE